MHAIRTLFVYVNPLRLPYLDLGLASLSAYLKKEGFDCRLADLSFDSRPGKVINLLKQYSPQVVAFSSRSGEFGRVVQVAGSLRRHHEAIYICGGVHPTVDPEAALSAGVFDGICRGEGERALHQLLLNLEAGRDFKHTPGFWFRAGEELVKNPLNRLIEDLDELPCPDYRLFDLPRYVKARNGQLDYVSARGCPFQCSFCINPALMRLNQGLGRYVRAKSAARMVRELKTIRAEYPYVTYLKIADEMFIQDQERLRELARTYPEAVGLPFECDVRADYCTDETLGLLKQMGCDKLNIAIESGDAELRNTLLAKNLSDRQIIDAFALARKYGIHTMSFNMVGLPRETEAQIRSTIDLNRRAGPDSIQVTMFTPFKGTELGRMCEAEGLLAKDGIGASYYQGVYLHNPNLSDRRLKQLFRAFSFLCYRERSLLKACILLARDSLIPIYLKYAGQVPDFLKQAVYFLFWKVKFLKFASK